MDAIYDLDFIKLLVSKKYTVPEIAQILDVPKQNLSPFLKRNNIKVSKTISLSLTYFQATLLADKYLSGESSYAIADEFGITPSSVLNIVKNLGYKVRTQNGISEERASKIDRNARHIDITVDWSTVERCGNDFTVYFKCNKCGMNHQRHLSNIEKKSFRCSSCIEEKQKSKLSSCGYTFIETVKKDAGSYSKFSCNCCGDVRELSYSNVLHMRSMPCSNCRDISVKAKLNEHGCSYVSDYYKRNCRQINYLDTTGELRHASASSILLGAFAKSSSHWDQKHFLYIFKSTNDNFPYMKIGTANDPNRRLKSLKLDFACDIHKIPLTDRFEANKLEQYLHSKFNEYSISKEVAESFTHGVGRGGNKSKKMGITEWFHYSIFDEIFDNYFKSKQ